MSDIERRRRQFVQEHHPDRGGDPEEFIAGLRAFDTEQASWTPAARVVQADIVAQGPDDVPLDVPGHFVHGVAVADGHGEIDDGGSPEYAHGGVRMMVLERGLFGACGHGAVAATAERDADAGDHAGAVAG